MRRKSWPWLALLLWLLWLRAFWASGPCFGAVSNGHATRVTIQQVLQGGAQVKAREGHVGFLSILGGREKDLKVGEELHVRVTHVNPENENNTNPTAEGKAHMVFRLQKKYEKMESAIEAQIIGFHPGGCPDKMEVDIDGMSFLLDKEDITNSKKPWDLLDVFSVGEVVKLCAMSTSIRCPHWSMGALERTPGAVLVNKTKVFEEANATLARARQFEDTYCTGHMVHNVTVCYVGAFGARVRTQDGFLGMISARDLGSKLRKLRVGERLAVEAIRVNHANKFQVNPRRMRDYPLIFSYSQRLKLELREKYNYKQGDVVEAKVLSLQPTFMVVEIDDVPFTLHKDAISSSTSEWEPAQIFAVNEVVKAVWLGGWFGSISMRALERWPGEMIEDTSQVLREAEDRMKELRAAWNRFVRSYEASPQGLQEPMIIVRFGEKLLSFPESWKPFLNVTVTSGYGFGARVRTEDGIAGLMLLSREFGTTKPYVGDHLTARLIELRPEYRFNVNPRIHEYPMIFAGPSIQGPEVAQRYAAGDVAEATIVGFTAAAMDVEVDGVPFCVKKVDITNSRNKTWEWLDVFATGEVVKLYCLFSDPSPLEPRRWSMRALEFAPGAVLANKTEVFERAEETAKLFLEKFEAAERKLMQTLDDALSSDPMDSYMSGDNPLSVSDVLADDDDDDLKALDSLRE